MNYYKRFFSLKIWSRGDIYYRSGRISNLQKQGNSYVFDVRGSDYYEVEIVTENNRLKDMYCTCPHALGGSYCKHMAASLMKLEAEGYLKGDGRIGKPKKPQNKWEDIAYDCTYEGEFKSRVDSKKLDSNFSQELVQLQNSLLTDKSVQNLKNTFKELECFHKALNYIDKYIEPKATYAAFQIVLQTLKDLDSERTSVWARRQLKLVKRKEIYSTIIPLVFTHDEKGLQAIDEQLKENNHTQIAQCLKTKIDIMCSLNYQPEQIIKSLKGYENYEDVLDYQYDYYMSVDDYQSVENILINALNVPNLNIDKVVEVDEKLEHLYIKTKNKEKYKEHLIEKVKTYHCKSDENYLSILKDMYDNPIEWKKDLKQLSVELKKETPYYTLIDLYYTAQEYGILFELLFSRYDLTTILKYYEEFIKYNKQFFMHAVYNLTIEVIDNSYSKTDYSRIINLIDLLKSLQGCEVLVLDILIYIKQYHSRKTLLMSMLENSYDNNYDDEWEELY